MYMSPAGVHHLRVLSQPFAVAEVFTGTPGKYVPLKETFAASRKSLKASMTTCLRLLSTW